MKLGIKFNESYLMRISEKANSVAAFSVLFLLAPHRRGNQSE